MPSYYIVSLVLYIYSHTRVLLTFFLCIVMHAHTTHAVIYKLYVVENKKFSADSIYVCLRCEAACTRKLDRRDCQ